MEIGKLDTYDLMKMLKGNRGAVRPDVKTAGDIGEDCSIVRFGDFDCVLSTDPVTAANSDLGKIAFNINCNDIASSGMEPLGLLVTILVPPSASLFDIENVMKEISNEAKKNNVQILGGHTEVTDSVKRMIVSCTAIGKGKNAVKTGGAHIDDDIIVTKKLCLEGTSILVNEYADKVSEFLTKYEIEEARSYADNLSVIKEGRKAGEFGVNSMHDITEGGVLGALYEVALSSGTGFIAYKEKLPITDVTKKVCSHFDIDPLRLISSGSMLITTKNGEKLQEEFKKIGIESHIIGKITKEKMILADGTLKKEVEPPSADEIYRHVH